MSELKSIYKNGIEVQNYLKTKKEPFLLVFSSSTCSPCNNLKPVLYEMSMDLPENSINILLVGPDDSPTSHEDAMAGDILIKDFKVRGLPALFIMKGSEIVAQRAGYSPANLECKQFLEGFVKMVKSPEQAENVAPTDSGEVGPAS